MRSRQEKTAGTAEAETFCGKQKKISSNHFFKIPPCTDGTLRSNLELSHVTLPARWPGGGREGIGRIASEGVMNTSLWATDGNDRTHPRVPELEMELMVFWVMVRTQLVGS